MFSIVFQDRSIGTPEIPDVRPDIAAVAIAYGCTLVTENIKDFPMPELELHPLSKAA